ncbi:FecR domain-containing protein [Pseudomonas sp. LB3P31]
MSSHTLAVQVPDQHVVRQALHWLLRLRNNAGNRRLHQQCDLWRAERQEHELAWQQVKSLHAELSNQPHAITAVQDALSTLGVRESGVGRRTALKMLSGLLVMGSAAWLSSDMLHWDQWNADFATSTGERRGFQLPDGTRLELNTASSADLEYTPHQRLIKLTRGEILVTCGGIDQAASFDRPLRVQSSHGLFEGVDARYVLLQQSNGTRLSVTAGRVIIHSPAAGSGVPVQVHPGQSYLVGHRQSILASPSALEPGAWVDGLIAARSMRLADFLAEVGRYRLGHLSCSADIADLQLTGAFRLDDTDELLASLAQTLPVQLHYRTQWWVTLQRRA